MSIPQIEAVRQAAWAAHRAGLCVVPPKEDGSKAPLGEWKEYQAARPTESELDQWYADSRQGVGLITGKISGNVELFEFDAVSEAYDPFVKLARAAGLGDVIERIETGYLETSPSGGIHWLYRCAEITGNTKLAERPKRPREKKHPKDNSQVLIETRGERGYAIVAPSFGRVHESGNPYELLHGAFDTIATITPEERTALWELARTFDQMPRKERPKERARRQEETRAGGRPGDDFNARTTWPEVIEAHGWERVYERGEIGYWRRPGKERDLSATTGFGGDWLYCFSTSTEFEAQQTYTKFAAYALLNHGGDYAAAARELAKRGFGSARHDAAQAQQEGDSEHYTDLGLARRLVALHGQDMRYCWPWAKWLCWNCQRWETDDSGQVIAWCQETVKAIYADAQIAFAAATEAASQGDKNAASAAKQKGDAIWRWAEKSEATARVNAAIEAARALPGMPVAPEELDADPWVLNVLNGTLNLKTGQIRLHRREDLLTKLAPVDFAPDAWLELWDRFLAEAIPDADMRRYVQKAAGSSLTGEAPDDVLLFLYGHSRTGKGTFADTMQNMLGDYATTSELSTFVSDRDSHGPRPDLAALRGKRMVVIEEVDDRQPGIIAMLKKASGGTAISTRSHHQETFTFRPQFKLWLIGNKRPRFPDDDTGLWTRLKVLPFTHIFDRPDPMVRKTLSAPEIAGAAVLAWAMQGCKLWQAEGLGSLPKAIQDATREYRLDMDPLIEWQQDRTVAVPDAFTPFKQLYADYRAWSKENGVQYLVGSKTFSQRLAERYAEDRQGKVGARGFVGIGLVSLDGQADTSEVSAEAEVALVFQIESSCGKNSQVSVSKCQPPIGTVSGDELSAKASPSVSEPSAEVSAHAHRHAASFVHCQDHGKLCVRCACGEHGPQPLIGSGNAR